jgi:hypothetical protein
MKLKSALLFVLCTLFLVSCNKNNIEQNDLSQSKNNVIDSRINEARIESKIWYDNAIKKIKEKNKETSPVVSLQSTNSTNDEPALVNDTAFVGLIYETINENLNTYSYYLNQTGDANFQNFVTALTNNGIDPVVTFNNYDLQIDTFVNNMTGIFAQAAIVLQNNPNFNNLSTAQQNAAVYDAITYYFPADDYQYAIPPSGIQVNGLMQEISSCLFQSVKGYLVGNIKIVRDIYNAITGSTFGYSFIYAMSGRILKQTLKDAGGWFGIAFDFSMCMIF